MKKIIAAISALVLLFTLAGCNLFLKEETTVYVYEEEYLSSKLTYYHKGDSVTKQTVENILYYEGIGWTESDTKEYFEVFYEEYEKLDGVVYEVVYEEDHVVEKVEINWEEVDIDQITSSGLIEFEGDIENGISLEESEQLVTASGYVKQED
ncbi:MAG: DUF1307 domain-containing protein [Bacilli bacterium]